MEKISGVLGSSPRLKSTDLQNSSAIRPGMPTFGRPVGESTTAHRKDLTTAQKANMLRAEMDADKKAMYEARAIQRIQDQFFMKQAELNAAPQVPVSGINPNLAAQPIESAPVNEDASESEVESTLGLTAEEMKYSPKGSFLDRSV